MQQSRSGLPLLGTQRCTRGLLLTGTMRAMQCATASRLTTTSLPHTPLQRRHCSVPRISSRSLVAACAKGKHNKQQDLHERPDQPADDASKNDRPKPSVASLTKDLKDSEWVVQAAATMRLIEIIINPQAMQQSMPEFVSQGTIIALSETLKGNNWGVKTVASMALAAGARHPLIAAEIPTCVYPTLAEILQQAANMTDEQWKKLVGWPPIREVQASAAVIAGEVAKVHPPGAAALGVIPQLVDLLDSKDYMVRVSACDSLGLLAMSDPVLRETIYKSGTLQKIRHWAHPGYDAINQFAMKLLIILSEELLKDLKKQ